MPRKPVVNQDGDAWGTILNEYLDTSHNLDGTLKSAAVPTHNHAASAINSGTMAPARLGSGTANNTKVLYGDQTWKDAPTGGGTSGAIVQTDEPASPTVGMLWYDTDEPDSGGTIATHTHAAADTTSGTFDVTRIPSLDASKIATGLLPISRGGTGQISHTDGNYLKGAGAFAITSVPASTVKTELALTKTDVGLGNVDNTSDAAKQFGASQVATGTVAAARLGSGTTDATTVLYGDNTWKTAPTGGGGTSLGFTPERVWNAVDYGVVANGKQVSDGAMTSGSATLTSATAAFVSGDVGKLIIVPGAAGVDPAPPLITTISGHTSATQVTLASAATSTVSGSKVTYGTDDRAGINSAINACTAAGGGVVVLPTGRIIIGSSPGITLKDRVHLRGAGMAATVVTQAWWGTAYGHVVIAADGTYTNTTPNAAVLTVTATPGQNVLTVDSTANLQTDGIYLLGSDAIFTDSPDNAASDLSRYKGEQIIVQEVLSATTVRLQRRVRDTYATGFAASIQPIGFLRGIGLSHLRIENSAPRGGKPGFVRFLAVRDFFVEHVSMEHAIGAGMEIDTCRDGVIRDYHGANFFNNPYDDPQRIGYGVNIRCACEEITISDCSWTKSRHAITTGGRNSVRGAPRNIIVANCTATGASETQNPFDCHSQGSNIWFVNCTATGSIGPGFSSRAPNTHIINCNTEFCGGGAELVRSAHTSEIRGCSFRNNARQQEAGLPTDGGYGIIVHRPKGVVIADNTIDRSIRSAIWIRENADGLTIERNRLWNSGIAAPGFTSGFSAIDMETGAVAAGMLIADNDFANTPQTPAASLGAGNTTVGVNLIAGADGTMVVNNRYRNLSGAFVAGGTNTKQMNNLNLTTMVMTSPSGGGGGGSLLPEFPTTHWPIIQSTARPMNVANGAGFLRVIGSGYVSKIGIEVAVSSGNISIGIYSNSGSGRAAVPGALVVSSGAIACPVAGFAEIDLGASYLVNEGDWFALSVDNTTATFRANGTGMDSNMAAGYNYRRSVSHPLLASPTSLTARFGNDFVMVGVA